MVSAFVVCDSLGLLRLERRKLKSVNSGHLGDTSDFVIQWISANA